MSHYFSNFPKRQKTLFVIAFGIGLFIWFTSSTSLLSNDSENEFIFFYSFILPFLLLCFPTIIDLNENNVFLTWYSFAIVLLIISISTNHTSKFIVQRSQSFDSSTAVNAMMATHSTAALKSLFCFLTVYWLLNQFSKKISGNYIVNTYKQLTWTNTDANRKMTVIDVISNIILYVTIFWSVLF